MPALTDLLKDYMEVSTQRKVLLSSFYFISGLLIYTYLYSLIGLFVIVVVLWYVYDYIDNSTASSLDPSGKYVFITGCDTGFGLDSAKAIRDLGFHVIAGCYDENSDGAKELKSRPWVQKVEVVHLDVTSDASVQAAVKEVKDICSDQGLWAVINNAGQNCMGPTELIPMSSYHRISEVNLFGAVRIIKYCLPLIRQAEGRIVNVLSERSYNHKAYSTPYCLTKTGLLAFSNCLRREMVEHKVKVIVVAPGEFAPATAICNKKINEAMKEPVMTEHAKLSLQDQEKAYPLEKVEALFKTLEPEAKASAGVPTTEPVLNAFIDAITREEPKECYMVHGTGRHCFDPHIMCARIRPFLPGPVMDMVEKILYRLLM